MKQVSVSVSDEWSKSLSLTNVTSLCLWRVKQVSVSDEWSKSLSLTSEASLCLCLWSVKQVSVSDQYQWSKSLSLTKEAGLCLWPVKQVSVSDQWSLFMMPHSFLIPGPSPWSANYEDSLWHLTISSQMSFNLPFLPNSSAHLDMRRKQHSLCSNSRFELYRSEALDHCFWNPHRHTLCLHYNGTWQSASSLWNQHRHTLCLHCNGTWQSASSPWNQHRHTLCLHYSDGTWQPACSLWNPHRHTLFLHYSGTWAACQLTWGGVFVCRRWVAHLSVRGRA